MIRVFDDVTNLEDLVQQVRIKLQCMAVLIHHLTESEQTVEAMAWPGAPQNFPISVPIGYSICQHTAESGAVLAVDDAFSHPLTNRHRITEVDGIAAYIGATIDIENGVRRTICAVERRRRIWEERDHEVLSMAAETARLKKL